MCSWEALSSNPDEKCFLAFSLLALVAGLPTWKQLEAHRKPRTEGKHPAP